MRVSISRIALLSSLLAGALPLSAKDDVDQPHAPHSTATSSTTTASKDEGETIIISSSSRGPQESRNRKEEKETTSSILNEEDDEGESSSSVEEAATAAAAEAVHDDGKLYTIPSLPAELLNMVNTTPPYTGESSEEESEEEEETKKAQHEEEALQDLRDKQEDDDEETIEKAADDDAGDSEITTDNASMSSQEEDETKSQEDQIEQRSDTEASDDDADTDDSNTLQSHSSSSEEEQQQQTAPLEEETNNKETQSSSSSSSGAATTTTETLKEKDETMKNNNEQKEQEEIQRQQQQQEDDDDSQSDSQEATSDSVHDNEETTKTEASSGAAAEEKKQDGKGDDQDHDDDNEEEEDGRSQRVQVDYANKAAGALILEKSSSMKGTSNLLLNDNDRYAISPCSDKGKYVIVGLSEDILVKTIKIANYERYSSPPKKFQVLGSSDMITFVDMGEFVAHSGNGEQAFELKEPAWARYLKFRFLTHYGAEHYCTVSQIKVHGSTMTQGFQEQYGAADNVQEEKNQKGVKEENEGEHDIEKVGSSGDAHDGDSGHIDANVAKPSDDSDAGDDGSGTENVKYQKDGQEAEKATIVDKQVETEGSTPTSSDAPRDAVDETVKTGSGSIQDDMKRGDVDDAHKDVNTNNKKNENSSVSCNDEECNDVQAFPSQNAHRSNAEAEAEGSKRSNASVNERDSLSSSDSATTVSTTTSLGNKNSEIPHEVKELASLVVNLGAISHDKGRSVGDDEEVIPEGGWQRTTPQSTSEGGAQNSASQLSSSSPTPLTTDEFNDDTETDVLSYASIGTSSSAKTSSAEGEQGEDIDFERGSTTVSMKDASYAVKNVIQTVRESASSTTVASAVKELQNIILTRIGSSVKDGGDVSLLTTRDADANENKGFDNEDDEQMENKESISNIAGEGTVDETKRAVQSSGSLTPEESLTDNDLSQRGSGASAKTSEGRNIDGTVTRTPEAIRSPKTAPLHNEDVIRATDEESKLGASATAGVHDAVSQKKQQSQGTGTSRSPHQNRGVDAPSSTRTHPKPSDGSSSSDSATDVFSSLSQKFPSMACLAGLDYQEFRANISRSVGGSGSSGSAGGAGAGGAGGGGPPNRIEPIFKTLTDEIKSLQNTQSAHEQYVGALQGCYQQIVLGMARHIETVESSQEDRLTKLEGALRDLQKERSTHWTQRIQQYAWRLFDIGSAATEQIVPILLAAIGWCYTYGQMFCLFVEDFVSLAVSSLLGWLLSVVENEEVKTWLESVAAMDKGTARQAAVFCCLVFWLVLTHLRLCRVQRRTKRKSITLEREEVKMVHLHDREITDNGAACPRMNGRIKTHRGDVHSHNIQDDMSCSDLSESETPLTPIELSPSA